MSIKSILTNFAETVVLIVVIAFVTFLLYKQIKMKGEEKGQLDKFEKFEFLLSPLLMSLTYIIILLGVSGVFSWSLIESIIIWDLLIYYHSYVYLIIAFVFMLMQGLFAWLASSNVKNMNGFTSGIKVSAALIAVLLGLLFFLLPRSGMNFVEITTTNHSDYRAIYADVNHEGLDDCLELGLAYRRANFSRAGATRTIGLIFVPIVASNTVAISILELKKYFSNTENSTEGKDNE